jgi:hypothetical protein
MKMHLNNILNQFEANEDERNSRKSQHHAVSHSAVVDYIDNLREVNSVSMKNTSTVQRKAFNQWENTWY